MIMAINESSPKRCSSRNHVSYKQLAGGAQHEGRYAVHLAVHVAYVTKNVLRRWYEQIVRIVCLFIMLRLRRPAR